nr:zinc finger, CCHC-type [Tanacetum cinerariifolium]
MAKLAFCDYHNMVAILEKTKHNTDFHQIVGFLEASHIRYALTIHPTVYVSHIRQFWSTVRVETTDGQTKILAQVNGRQRTVSESSIMRHLKLNDKEDESIHHEQITQSPQHAQITSPEPFPQSHEQTTSQEPTIPSQSHYVITTPRRITRGTIRISQSKVPSPGVDETAFPTEDVRYGKAFPTNTSLDAGQDRENIAKTSAMPHEELPRVTSLGGGEGSMQQKLQELMDICTNLQRQHSFMEERIQSQDLEIIQLKTRVKTLEDNEKKREGFTQEDAPNTRGWIKGRISSGGLRSVFTTASISVTTASTDISPIVATASGSFPTAAIFTTASVATPTTRVTRSSRGVLARDLKAKFAQEDLIIREQAKRDSEIARIHAEKELEMMIAELDRSNEMVTKYLSEYEQAALGLSHDEKVELINDVLMYQRHLAQIKKYQAQQNKPATKTERRNFYMSMLRSNACWKAKDFKGITFEQIEEKFIPVEDLDKLWSLVKETYSTPEVTDEKAKELWMEYQVWGRIVRIKCSKVFPLLGMIIPTVRLSVPTADVYIAKKLATIEDFALLHEDKIYSESKTRRTAKLCDDIMMFQQHHRESLSEAWAHFKDLLQRVSQHGIDLWLQESLELGNNESAFVQREVFAKMEHLRVFTLPCRLGLSNPFDTLADLGSCVNIIPLYLFKKLNIKLLEETDHIFGLVDGTKSYPVRILHRKTKTVKRFLRTQSPYYARKDFLDCHFLEEWEIARDAKINPFKDSIVFRRMVEFLGALPINFKRNMWECEDLIENLINWDKPPKDGDGAWHAKIRIIDPDGEKFTKTLQPIPTTRKLSERESLREIINLDHFYDT